MDINSAKQINDLMLEYGAKLDESIRVVLESDDSEAAARYKKAVGKLMATMLMEVMNPIYEEHVSLKPSELK